ncbi:hypothetical protein [Saccharopolyspora hattusasensis]|uniref:hypothetical protein n=1 Tax=Saccharopolyspora hattusasensis TaxID=1128679 RepID=UPI003D9525E8
MIAEHIRVARCTNVIEHNDLTAAPCTGLLRFTPDDVQAKCDTCGAWCGSLVADYISDLHARLLAVIGDKAHQTITFRDLDEVPVGSIGYLSPGGRQVHRDEKGWFHDGRRVEPEPGKYTFTSHSGPANDERLAELLEATLVPEHHVLVDFEAVTDSESDWELGYTAEYTDLVHPEILGHRLSETDLAHLYFQIEAVGGLGESGAYRDLDKQIEELGEGPAEALRTRARTQRSGFLELDHIETNTDKEGS